MRKLLLIGLLFSIPMVLTGQEASYDELMAQGRRAVQSENYQGAIEFFTKAKKLRPLENGPFEALGDIYTSKKLYALAAEEFLVLHNRMPSDRDFLYQLAETYGLLNDNEKSISYFEKALKLFPADRDIILALSWMYLKVEKLEKGVEFLEKKINELGSDRSFEMYLATLYSDLYEYEKSRAHYLKAIAMSGSDSGYISLVYYNLSLLEATFYRFDRAFSAAQSCLEKDERSGGHIILGELYQNRMDFRKSLDELEKADKSDLTPYAKYDLVQIYLQFGYLEQAQAYLKKIEEKKDDSWMYNYGITKKKFDRDLNQTWYKIYSAQAALVDFDPKPWFWDWIIWFFKKMYFLVQAWFHEMTYRQYTQELAGESAQAGATFKNWLSLYQAYDNYPDAAKKYLVLSRGFELAKTKRGTPAWLLEEGKQKKDPALLLKAIEGFQKPDENEQIATALQTVIPLLASQGRQEEALTLTNQLYKLNPGGLLTSGLSLPIQLNVYGPGASTAQAKILEYSSWCGFNVAAGGRKGVEYTLNVQVAGDGSWRYNLKDGAGVAVFSDFAGTKDMEEPGFLKNLFQRIHRLP